MGVCTSVSTAIAFFPFENTKCPGSIYALSPDSFGVLSALMYCSGLSALSVLWSCICEVPRGVSEMPCVLGVQGVCLGGLGVEF